MINKVTLVGNLGADPESRTATSGNMVTNLRVATTSREKDGDAWKDVTEWHRVVAFGKTAENAARFLKKGRQVYIEGTIRTRKWEKDGATQYSTEIIANEIKFIGPNPDAASDSAPRRDAAPPPSRGSRNPPPRQQSYDEPPPGDDIPF